MNDIAELTLKINTLEAKLAKVELDNLKKSSKELGDEIDKLIDEGFKKLMAVLGPAALTAVLIENIKHAVELQAAYVKLSEVAGTTAATFSGFDEPARLAGVALDTVAHSIARLSREIGQAKLGDPQAGGLLKALGLNINDGRDAAEQFVDISKALLSMKDQTVASAVAQQLLGRNFSELRPLMKEIVEQGGIHARVTNEQAEAAKHFDDSITKLTSKLEKNRIEFVNSLIPAMDVFIDKLNVLIGATDKLSLVTLQRQRNALVNELNRFGGEEFSDPLSGEQMARSKEQIIADIDAIDKLIIAENKAKIAILETNKARSGGTGKDGNAAVSDAEARVKQFLEDKKHYEERLNLLKAAGQQFAEQIKLENKLAEEAYKQSGEENLATQTALLQKQADNNQRNLEQQRKYLEQQRKLSLAQGDFSKAGEAMGAINQINAQIVANEAITQAQIQTLRAQTNRKLQDEYGTVAEVENRAYALRLKALDAYLNEYGNKVTNAGKMREKLEAQHHANLGEVQGQGIKQRIEFEEMSLSGQAEFLTGFFTSATATAATHNKKMFELNKLAGEAQIIVSTTIGVMKAWEMGPILGPIMAAVVAAAGLVNLRALRATQFGGGGSIAPSTASAAGGATPVFPVNNQTATTGQSAPGIQVTVHVEGNMVGNEEFADQIRDSIKRAVDDQDFELIGPNSRNAANLRTPV
jgi:hypothetical protein